MKEGRVEEAGPHSSSNGFDGQMTNSASTSSVSAAANSGGGIYPLLTKAV